MNSRETPFDFFRCWSLYAEQEARRKQLETTYLAYVDRLARYDARRITQAIPAPNFSRDRAEIAA